MELIKDTKNRNLGKKNHKCRICGEEGLFQSYLVREMMKGTKDEFEYFVCPKCNCLQIADVPDNLGYYYGNDYYSMKYIAEPDCKFDSPVLESTKILDMGCGIGAWLYEMAKEGHDNLYGCDPFIEDDIYYGKRVYIKKCDITEMEGDGTFDFIRMSDSFEHVTNPKEVLYNASRLLGEKGTIWMSLPTYPNIAFDMFETHWYQLDAPRHIFLHSVMSLKHLADECGLEIMKINYDSNCTQIIRSFFYQNGITYNDTNAEIVSRYFTDKDIQSIEETSSQANKIHHGDHMQVYMRKRQ